MNIKEDPRFTPGPNSPAWLAAMGEADQYVELDRMSDVKADYSFVFDKAKDSWICSVHGEVDSTAWVPCWNGCDEGYFDDYEEDPIECEPGEISTCSECRGQGGWRVCGECNANNPDAEF